jgi:hypothetical protein
VGRVFDFALTTPLRELLKAHVSDAPREQLAEHVVAHLELTFEIDEAGQCLRKRAPAAPHGGVSGGS